MKYTMFQPYFNIFGMTQEKLKGYLCAKMKAMGREFVSRKGYLYSPGHTPVMLVAHLDTVHKTPVQSLCASPDGILMSPEGIGGDDRCGVMMILELMKEHNCHILFCEDEETGAVGARCYVRDMKDQYPDLNYIVEIDRHGTKDCVFYDCDNEKFVDFVEQFGFKENYGTFSDISVLAPAIGAAAVNISSGYFHEHTTHEHVDLGVMERNVACLSKMISTYGGKFEYIPSKWYGSYYGRSYGGTYKGTYGGGYYGGWYDADDELDYGSYYDRASGSYGSSSKLTSAYDDYDCEQDCEMGQEQMVLYTGIVWRDFQSRNNEILQVERVFNNERVYVDSMRNIYIPHNMFDNVMIIQPDCYADATAFNAIDFTGAETYEWYTEELLEMLMSSGG